MTTKPITAGELRIGNLVLDSTKNTTIVESIIPEHNRIRYGIPLSPEWLERAGARKSNEIYCLSLTSLKAEIHFEVYPNEIVSILRSQFCELILDEIKYVHTFQNLVHALTGTELTFKQ